MSGPLLTGIDVGTTKICTLVGEVVGDGDLEIIGVGIEPARGMRKGMVVNIEEASQAIAAAVDKAERTSGYEIGRALVSLAGSHISSVNSHGAVGVARGHRGIDQDDIERALDAAQAIAIPHNREILHVIPRGFAVDGNDGIRHPIGMHGFRLEVEAHIITAAKTSIQNLTKCVESAGVQVESYVLNPLASAEVVLTETEKEMGVVCCDIGGGTTDLAIYIDGNVWHTMVISVGGNHLTSDIAHGLRLPADVAERLKIEHGQARRVDVGAHEFLTVRPFGAERAVQVSAGDLAEVIEARVEELFTLILQEVKRTGYDGLLPAGIVLTGGTARLPGLRAAAADVLGMPARVAQPDNLRGLVDALDGPAYSTSVGLLQWAARDALEDERRPAAKKGRKAYQQGQPIEVNVSRGLDWFKRLLP
jgi:cell division protein FtsA